MRPSRVLEIGTALAYGTLWLAHGSGGAAPIETVEQDPVHAEMARAQLAAHGHSGHVDVLEGNDLSVLPDLEAGTYDVIVYDADVPTPRHLELFDRLLSQGGLLISSNLFLGQYVFDLPDLEKGAEYREALFGRSWITAFAREKALTFRARP
jgi:predicted O-methyltransferase YrrM